MKRIFWLIISLIMAISCFGQMQEGPILDEHSPYSPYRYINSSGDRSARTISYWIDFPSGNSVADRRIKAWMSDVIHKNLTYQADYYVSCFDGNPTNMLDYYSNRFFIGDSIDERNAIGDYYSGSEFRMLRRWESDTYVTYLCSVLDDKPVNSWMSPSSYYLTFNKQTGEEISESDIFLENREQEVTNIIWDVLKEELWKFITSEDSDMPIEESKEEYNSILEYLGGEECFDWHSELSTIALAPTGVFVHYVTRSDGTVFTIPYEKINQYMAITPMVDGKDVFLESIQKASSQSRTVNRSEFGIRYIPDEHRLSVLADERGQNSGEYLLALCQLAEVYSTEESRKCAIGLRQEYLDVVNQMMGIQNAGWKTNAHRQLRDLLAEKEYKQASVIGDNLLGTWSEDAETMEYEERELRCAQLLMTAEAFYGSGHPQKAIELCERAIQTTNEEEARIEGMTKMSRYQFALNRTDSCLHYINQSVALVPKLVIEKFHEYTAIQRKELWEKFNSWYCEFLPYIAFITNDDQLLIDSYDAMLFGKGLLLNTESSIRQMMVNSGDTLLLRKYEYLSDLKNSLNDIRMKKMDYDEKLERTDEILEKMKSTERELIKSSRLYSNYMNRLYVSSLNLSQVLRDHELAMEFALVEGRYYALLMKRNMAEPVIIGLCSEEQLQSTTDIYNAVWKPIEDYLQDVSDIYFSPSGSLYHVGIEYAIIPSDDRMTINEKFNIYRLSSTRELVFAREKYFSRESAQNSAILYGGIDYECDFTDVKADNAPLTYRTAYHLRDIERGSEQSLPYLPGTMKEVESIERTLKDASSPFLVNTYCDTYATEGSFKSLSGHAYKVIHIATHGFYITKKDAEQAKDNLTIDITVSNDHYVEDMELMRSGLILAGALAEKENKNADDGILTALEIASMDMSGIDLVVLSACETALGDVSSDGVLGLQRGFKKAGANTLLMSLWKVDDTATQLLMTEFYRNMVSGRSKNEALLGAQRYLRQCEGGKYDKPEYWAAFILLDGIDS